MNVEQVLHRRCTRTCQSLVSRLCPSSMWVPAVGSRPSGSVARLATTGLSLPLLQIHPDYSNFEILEALVYL